MIGVLYANVGGQWEEVLGGTGHIGWDPGDLKSTVATVATAGWLMLNGASYPNANVTYSALWMVIPASWKSGTTMILPNVANRVLMGGGTVGAVGGSNSLILAVGNLPAHAHSITHNHDAVTATTASDGAHNHNIGQDSEVGSFSGSLSRGKIERWVGTAPIYQAPNHNHTVTVNLPSFSGNSTNTGSGTAKDITPSHLRVNWMIKT